MKLAQVCSFLANTSVLNWVCSKLHPKLNKADIGTFYEVLFFCPEKDHVKFERGNGLVCTNNNNIMVEFEVSLLEKDLITTDRRELKDIEERLRRKCSYSIPAKYADQEQLCHFPQN